MIVAQQSRREGDIANMMRIGELADRFGINPKTIRYYEALGLLPQPERTESGYRQYTEADAARLDFIGKAKRLGLSLEEICSVLAMCDEGQLPCSHVLELLDQRISGVDHAIEELQAFRSELAGVRAGAAARIPEGSVCGIIEHQTLPFAQLPAYLRGRGLARGDSQPLPQVSRLKGSRQPYPSHASKAVGYRPGGS